jgi:hypothetical protein
MPSIGIMASSYTVTRIADKAAVQPTDVFAADPLMPAFVNTATLAAERLTYCGFYPDPAFMLPWISPQKFTYNGASYYWTGSRWEPGTGATKVTFYADSLGPSCSTDFSRMSIANRLLSLERLFTPSPNTAWPAGSLSWTSTVGSYMQHGIRWNGSNWELAVTSPEFTGLPWSKVITPGFLAPMDPNVSIADAATAASLTATLGYTYISNLGAPGLQRFSISAVSFPHPSSNVAKSTFYWTGTAFTVTNASNYGYQAGGDVVHAGLAALPAADRPWLAQGYLVPTSAETLPWTPTTQVIVGGTVMSRSAVSGPLVPGPAPGVLPAVPTKTALMPSDIYTNRQSEIPPMLNGTTDFSTALPSFFTAMGYRPATAEKLPWISSSPTKRMTYLNSMVAWNGTHWIYNMIYSKTSLSDTSFPVSFSKSAGSSPPAIGTLATDAERIDVMNAYYTASPLTPWTADQHQWVGNCIVQWDGSSWVILAKPVTIHEAATYACIPGDVLYDTRVTNQNSTIANQLSGWGYVPTFRTKWTSGLTSSVALYAYVSFPSPNQTLMNPTSSNFYWSGTAWTAGTGSPTGVVIAPGAVQTDAAIAALPADERVVACTLFGYYSTTNAHWTSGQSATIGGTVVHWHGSQTRRYWAAGAAP